MHTAALIRMQSPLSSICRVQRHGVTPWRAGDGASTSAPYSTCARGGPASTSGQAANSWSQSVAAQSYEAACVRTRTALQWKALVFSNSLLCSTLGQVSLLDTYLPLAPTSNKIWTDTERKPS